jgi:hypothetical protein
LLLLCDLLKVQLLRMLVLLVLPRLLLRSLFLGDG